MLIGATAKSVDDIASRKNFGFDFAEVLIPNTRWRRLWWESGINSKEEFFLVAHGPLEDLCDDIRSLRDHYLPTLKATIDTAGKMGIALLTIHLKVDSSVSHSLLIDKQMALKELVDYGLKSNVSICLENVTESAEDLAAVLDAVPELGITLDVGHAHLLGPSTPLEIMQCVGPFIRHVHLHDNLGEDDRHLLIGAGNVDFHEILYELVGSGYAGTMTLELAAQDLIVAKNRLRDLIEKVTRPKA